MERRDGMNQVRYLSSGAAERRTRGEGAGRSGFAEVGRFAVE